MKKIYYAAHTYMIIGVISGLVYRELTKMNDFVGDTQLAVVHTHLLALGMLFHLILLVLEKQFTLSSSKLFSWSFWIYNVGVVLTVAIMTVHGIQTILGVHTSAAIAGTAGIGHIILTLGLILFFVNLGRCISDLSVTQHISDDLPTHAERAVDSRPV
ncbi:DUF2871 domain-containing protein [Nocardia sp. NPDC051463]|uniref:DUF2871 domain-containing protein n=1 Tax=Nocardia sp. NPDC051463 TaxID=3154845 RepID=UPI00343972F3